MSDGVRVRFAPSPTGEPHVGNIRTALFNWLFARHTGGAFVVRIEDTDQERKVEGALESILASLRWLGLDWDEGPESEDGGSHGNFGPYFQSERLALYHEAAEKLLAGGDAYQCFCSPERLDAMRKEQQRNQQPPGYDRHCLTQLTAEERGRRAAVEPHVIRFRIPREDGTIYVNDFIRGQVAYEPTVLDDFVILKSDGYPTYHLANVVDDHFMEISHVMRAEEWLPSTPRHVLLYRSLDWEPPVFAHLPMILGPDRSKLSKRHGATSTLAYQQDGYLPEALTNFMALLGWSLDDHTEVFSRDELVEHFDLDRVGKAGAIFNAEKLTWMNGLYIRQLPPEELAERILPFLERPHAEGGLSDSVERPLDAAFVATLTPLIQERLKRLDEAPELLSLFFEGLPSPAANDLVPKGVSPEQAAEALTAVVDRLTGVGEWEEVALEDALRPMADELGLKTGQLFGAVRAAVTGRTVSPPLFATMVALGRTHCMDALNNAVATLQARA
ncbi:MAG: glutamate--tRNA ligase [Chloroflexota bacterium]|nr:glutamate--tRNA ligase [Chloroflexota bacterium]